MARIKPINDGPILKGMQKRPRVKDREYLETVHHLPCILTGSTPVEAAHLRSSCLELGKRSTGMAEKPNDIYVVPLSPEKHREQHSMNEQEFWKSHGFEWKDIVSLAQALYIHRDNIEAQHQIVELALMKGK